MAKRRAKRKCPGASGVVMDWEVGGLKDVSSCVFFLCCNHGSLCCLMGFAGFLG